MATKETLEEQVAALKAQLEAAQAANAASITPKLSPKGGISVYGIGRNPVTLYEAQWQAVLGAEDAIRECLAKNKSMLADKGDDAEAKLEKARRRRDALNEKRSADKQLTLGDCGVVA